MGQTDCRQQRLPNPDRRSSRLSSTARRITACSVLERRAAQPRTTTCGSNTLVYPIPNAVDQKHIRTGLLATNFIAHAAGVAGRACRLADHILRRLCRRSIIYREPAAICGLFSRATLGSNRPLALIVRHLAWHGDYSLCMEIDQPALPA